MSPTVGSCVPRRAARWRSLAAFVSVFLAFRGRWQEAACLLFIPSQESLRLLSGQLREHHLLQAISRLWQRETHWRPRSTQDTLRNTNAVSCQSPQQTPQLKLQCQLTRARMLPSPQNKVNCAILPSFIYNTFDKWSPKDLVCKLHSLRNNCETINLSQYSDTCKEFF